MTVQKLQTGVDAPLDEDEFLDWLAFFPVKNWVDREAAEAARDD
jgi:hypothetical protein